MTAFVRLLLPDGATRDLPPESIIGRMASATLRLNEPHIAEAHALISLRGSQLRLLALRGKIAVDGVPATDAVLRPGMRLELGGRTTLVVDALSVAARALALEGPGVPRHVLGGVASLAVVPMAVLASGFAPDADLVFWTEGDAVWVRVAATGEDRRLAAGDHVEVAGRRYAIVAAYPR